MVCVQVFWESSLASPTLHRNEPQLPLSECRGFVGTAERYITDLLCTSMLMSFSTGTNKFSCSHVQHSFGMHCQINPLLSSWQLAQFPPGRFLKPKSCLYCWLLPLSPDKFNLALDRIRQLVALSPAFKQQRDVSGNLQTINRQQEVLGGAIASLHP